MTSPNLKVPQTGNRSPSSASTLHGEPSSFHEKDAVNGSSARDSASIMMGKPEAINTAPVAEDDIEYPTGIKMTFIVVALVLSIFLLSLDMTIVATAIPKITDEFQGLEKVGWYGAAFFMTVGAFQSTWGKIYKFFPLKTSFLIAILIFEVGSTICGAAPNANTLIADFSSKGGPSAVTVKALANGDIFFPDGSVWKKL